MGEKGCIVVAGLAPHPPIIVPEIGGSNLQEVTQTCSAMNQWARSVACQHPESIVIFTPHGPAYRNAIPVICEGPLKGDFSGFGVRDLEFTADVDEQLASAIVDLSEAAKLPVTRLMPGNTRFHTQLSLDHGIMVPLYYLRHAGVTAPLVPVGISLLKLKTMYEFGKKVQEAILQSGKRAAVLASGDLSHRLTRDAPAGYSSRGKEFDKLVIDALASNNVSAILDIDPSLPEAAGECGLRPIVMMLGAISGLPLQPEVLSYEGPFGVGYGVVIYKTGKSSAESPHVQLAKKSLQNYLKTGKYLPVPENIDPELTGRAGVFVSIKKHGNLRGCIGTISPTQPTIAEEIIHNAVSSGVRDPRFPPVRLDELPELEFSVDVLSEPEKISSLDELDPKKYGVIVRKGNRSGLLLPDLEGVDTVEQQVMIAMQKAGISPSEKGVELYRFTVTRYH